MEVEDNIASHGPLHKERLLIACVWVGEGGAWGGSHMTPLTLCF